jgi:hypothetical protein
MYQFPLTGGSFELDNQTVYHKLKAFLIDSPGWAWIELLDMAENGRAAYITWTEHYNGEGELSKKTAMAKSKLENLHYKNEDSMSFERCTEIMTKCFNTLHKDPDQRFSDCQKVEKLLKAIRCSDSELLAAKAIIDQNFPRNFIGACGYFSQQVARIHGPAQLEYHQSRHRKRGISAVNTRPNRGGRGRGRFENCSGGRGGGQGDHGWGGRGGRSYGHVINRIDVLLDPNRSFTAQEWEALGPDGGRTTVMQMRERLSGRGGRESRGQGRGARGVGTNERNVSATNTQEYEGEDDADTSTITTSKQGGRNGWGWRVWARRLHMTP